MASATIAPHQRQADLPVDAEAPGSIHSRCIFEIAGSHRSAGASGNIPVTDAHAGHQMAWYVSATSDHAVTKMRDQGNRRRDHEAEDEKREEQLPLPGIPGGKRRTRLATTRKQR